MVMMAMTEARTMKGHCGAGGAGAGARRATRQARHRRRVHR